MKFLKVFIPVFISLFIFISCFSSFSVSADETTTESPAITEAFSQNDYSNFFYDSYNYDQDYYDLYDYFLIHAGFLSADFSLDDFTGFCFKTSFFDDYTTYYFLGIPPGLNEYCSFGSSDSGNGIFKFNFQTSVSGKYQVSFMSMRVYSNGNSSVFSQTTNYLTGLSSLYSDLNDHEQLIYDSNQHRIFSSSSPDSSDHVKYFMGSEFTLNSTCFPIGSGWKNTFSKLSFTVTPDLIGNIDLSTLSSNFQIVVDNPTSKNYNYMIFVSPFSANINLNTATNNMTYCLSSIQWAMQYSWKSTKMSSSDVGTSVVDWITSNYGPNIYNFWGGLISIGKQFVDSQDDGFFYYQLGQCKCPFYLIASHDTKTHVINYSDLGLDLNTDYFLNIVYYDVSSFCARPTSSPFDNTWIRDSLSDPLPDSAYSRYSKYPIYNMDLLKNYSCYSASSFKVTNGTFNKNGNDIYKYDDVIKNSDPGSASATISSDDDKVNVNTNSGNSYDSSVKTSYYNYGTIYHNCTISYGASSGSGSTGPASPVLPEDQFDDLYSQSGGFFNFIDVVFAHLPAFCGTLLGSALAVVLFCRIWGR